MEKRIKSILIILVFSTQIAVAQKKTDKYFDVTISPSVGVGVLGQVVAPSKYKGTALTYRDSLKKSGRIGQSFNFGVQYFTRKNAFNAFSAGISYTTLSFRRIAENLQLGTIIHPKVGVVSGLIQAANLRVKYDYRYHYAEASVLWHRSAEGYGNLKEFDLWYFGGFSPAILIQDRVHIFTEGFTLNGTNTFNVKDDDITPFRFNLIGQVGFRADYYMYKNIHGLIQPRLRIPLLPSSAGTQSIWIPQLSLDLGLIFLIE